MHNLSTAGEDFQCRPLCRAAAEATEQLILSSTNPSMLPWTVWEDWMHCPVRHPTRPSGFIFSSLVFAGKDKNHNLSCHESFPLTQALPATSREPAPRRSSVPRKRWASPAEPGHTPKPAARRAIKALASRGLSCF